MRLLFWVQSLLGSGHLRRALRISRACADAGFEVTLVNGGPLSPWPAPKGIRILQLPVLRAADATFSALVDEDGRPAADALWRARAALLATAVEQTRPHLVLLEMFPFGRRAFARELEPWLARARNLFPRLRVAISVRDVLVRKTNPDRYREMAERANRLADAVLVHGDAALLPFEASFPARRLLSVPLRHTGYVVEPPPPVPAERRGIVVSAGGGAVGARLLETALAAHPLCRLADEPWLLVAGRHGQGETLRRRAPPGVTVRGHDPDLPAHLAAARVSVSQAGYNTVAETLACGTPMVLVPFAESGEDEQTVRARRLAAKGLARTLDARDLTPAALARAIEEAARTPPGTRSQVALEGARRSARLLRRLVEEGALPCDG